PPPPHHALSLSLHDALPISSGQPIFAVDDATAESIRATFVIDVSLIRSFGRTKKVEGKDTQLGLSEKQQEFLVALALWKIQKLLDRKSTRLNSSHVKISYAV